MRKNLFKTSLVGVVAVLLLVGCGNAENSTESGSVELSVSTEKDAEHTEGYKESEVLQEGKDDSKQEVIDYPKLEEIEYFFRDSIVYEEPTAVFGYKNNSDFTIVRFYGEFKMKADITTEQLAVFDTLREKRELTDEDILGFKPQVYDYMVCDSGEEVCGAMCYMEYNLEPVSTAQCEYMDLDYAEIMFVAADDKIHTVRYSAVNGAYVLDEDAEDVYVWSDSSYANMVPKPDTRILELDYDDEDYFQCSAYDMGIDDFKTYIVKSQEAGFVEVEDNETSYWAKNEQGYMLHVLYRSHMNMIEISLELDD